MTVLEQFDQKCKVLDIYTQTCNKYTTGVKPPLLGISCTARTIGPYLYALLTEDYRIMIVRYYYGLEHSGGELEILISVSMCDPDSISLVNRKIDELRANKMLWENMPPR